MVGTLGLAPSWQSHCFTDSAGTFTVNVPLGWSMGLAPIYSRFTASRLDDFGIDHSPPGVNRTLTDRLSGDCTTVVLQAGMSLGDRDCTCGLSVPNATLCY